MVEVVGGVADAELCDGFGGDAAAGEVLAGAGGLGAFECGFEVLRRGFVDVDELAAQAGFVGFFGGAELALGQRDAALGGDDADGFGEADVLHLHDEGEDVALFVAAEAVEVAVGGVDGEGAGLFFVEGAEAGVVLGAGFAQLDVVADDADDVGLLLDELGEVIGHGRCCEVLCPMTNLQAIPFRKYSGKGAGRPSEDLKRRGETGSRYRLLIRILTFLRTSGRHETRRRRFRQPGSSYS